MMGLLHLLEPGVVTGVPVLSPATTWLSEADFFIAEELDPVSWSRDKSNQ